MRRHAQQALALSMLAMCAAIGSIGGAVTVGTVSWLGRQEPSDGLRLSARSAPHSMRIRNLNADDWSSCIVTLDGGYASPRVPIGPRSLATIPYAVFANQGIALGDADGFGRGFRFTAVECADREQGSEYAVLR